MACPAVHSGENFLASALAHVDCQARAIGAYGYGALADPGSPVALALNGLLVIFVALFGVRLLTGHAGAGRDAVAGVLRIGVVLALATSWPAWRVLGYDLVINGPGELARAIGLAAQLPGARGDLAARLGAADEALFALNQWGAGRLAGISQGDWFQLGLARTAFLAGTLMPLALIRLVSGILLAIAPLVAGLMLFGITRPLFAGWVRGLAMCFLASLALTLVIGVELALLEPWLQDTLARRVGGEELLNAPSESLALTSAFALVALGAIAICARIAFHAAGTRIALDRPWAAPDSPAWRHGTPLLAGLASRAAEEPVSHARGVVQAISEGMRREERLAASPPRAALLAASQSGQEIPSAAQSAPDRGEALGGSWRRAATRVSRAGQRRDIAP